MTKLLLLDLDGTVREPISDSKFINDPLDQRIIQGAKIPLEKYEEEGW